ncbi:acyltransferase family protein [Clostridium felsineum]|uniref:acyltransferase family protein n=1 Tax=Clostridium felsineum TaxID=36839 RepID=UPI00098CC5F1|nr:acyltransferase family protein [Clostridium felsineum]URZ03576.1 hypothetical protein CLAUR_036370 [Clostridium felsineum]
MENKRSIGMDVIKGLGIIAIVIGHTQSPLLRFVYSYHVVLFFFISGYFYKEEYRSKPIELIKKRIKTLYVPFITYEFIFLILHNVFVKFNIYNYQSYGIKDFVSSAFKILTFHEIQSDALGQFWFIKVLFITNIVFWAINFVLNKLKVGKKEVVGAVFMILLFAADVVVTKHVGSGKGSFTVPTWSLVPVSLLAFFLGSMYKKYKAYIKLNLYLAVLSLSGIILSCQFVGTNMGNFYMYPIVFVTNSVLGIYLNLYLAEVLVNKKRCGALAFIGKNSLSILALHMISFKVVNLMQINIYKMDYSYLSSRTITNHSDWWIVYALFGVVMPIVIAMVVDRIKNIGDTIRFVSQKA